MSFQKKISQRRSRHVHKNKKEWRTQSTKTLRNQQEQKRCKWACVTFPNLVNGIAFDNHFIVICSNRTYHLWSSTAQYSLIFEIHQFGVSRSIILRAYFWLRKHRTGFRILFRLQFLLWWLLEINCTERQWNRNWSNQSERTNEKNLQSTFESFWRENKTTQNDVRIKFEAIVEGAFQMRIYILINGDFDLLQFVKRLYSARHRTARHCRFICKTESTSSLASSSSSSTYASLMCTRLRTESKGSCNFFLNSHTIIVNWHSWIRAFPFNWID